MFLTRTSLYKLRDLHIFCILIIGFRMLYNLQIYFNTNFIILNEKEYQFSLLQPENGSFRNINHTILKYKDQVNQLIDRIDFSFLLNPPLCKDTNAGFLLLIMVSSKPDNFKHREALRNTWARTTEYSKVVFLLGVVQNSSISEDIKVENYRYGDIVQGNFVDAYVNMTYKYVMGLKWVLHHCSTAKYVLKADDDIVVPSDAFMQLLVRQLSPWGATDLILCRVISGASVFRQNSKWAVHPKDYAHNMYPRYCAGYAVIYSPDVIHRLLAVAQQMKYFWIDDVFITGLAREEIAVAPSRMNPLMIKSKQAKLIQYLGPFYSGKFYVGPGDLAPEKIITLWNVFQRSGLDRRDIRCTSVLSRCYNINK